MDNASDHSTTAEKPVPKKGERWVCGRTNRTVRVMADPIEGYVLFRFKGSMPHLLHKNDWHGRFIAKDT